MISERAVSALILVKNFSITQTILERKRPCVICRHGIPWTRGLSIWQFFRVLSIHFGSCGVFKIDQDLTKTGTFADRGECS